MLRVPSIGIVNSFSESGLGISNHYIMRGVFYVERDVWLRRGGFLLYGLSYWRIVIFSMILEINRAKHPNLSCSLG